MPYLYYLTLTFSVNFFFGMWRVNTKRFSWQWLGAIHLPVPLIIFARLFFNISPLIIPAGIIAAIVGQLFGGKLYLAAKKSS